MHVINKLLSDFLCNCLWSDVSKELLDDKGDATVAFKSLEFPLNWSWCVLLFVHRGRLFLSGFLGVFGCLLLYAFCDPRLEFIIDSLFAMYLSTDCLKLDWSVAWPIRSFLLYDVGVCSNLVGMVLFILYCCFWMLREELFVDNMKLLSLL